MNQAKTLATLAALYREKIKVQAPSLKVRDLLIPGGAVNKSDPDCSINFLLESGSAEHVTVCIMGHPGVGKTTLLLSTLREWTTAHPTKLTLYFDMKDWCSGDTVFKDSVTTLRTRLRDTLRSSFLYCELDDSTLAAMVDIMLKPEGGELLLLLDHIDELDTTDSRTSIFQQILSRELLPKARIITASHFLSIDAASAISKAPCSYHILEGIKPGSELELLDSMRTEFKDDHLYELIKYHCLDLCSVPGMIKELFVAFKQKPQTTNIGYTEVVESLILSMINKQVARERERRIACALSQVVELGNTQAQSLTSLSEDHKFQLQLLGKLAYQSIEGNNDNYCYSDLSKFITLESGVELKSFQDLGLFWLFLVKTTETLKSNKDCLYKFAHPIIQAFLAAYYVATEPLLDQIRLIRENMDAIFGDLKFGNVIKFYFGMGRILTEEINAGKKTELIEPVWTRKALLETVIASQMHLEEEPDVQRDKLIFVFELLHESKDQHLARKFLSSREKHLKLSLKPSLHVSDPLIRNLAFVICNSAIPKWTIETSESAKNSAEYISMLVKKESSDKTEVRIRVADGDIFVIEPVVKGGVQQLRVHEPSLVYVRCMREVLHRLLQLHSPIKLKSNGTESSYVSFLACSCLREKLEEEHILELDGITGIHWISVKSKDTKPKTSEEVELHRHMVRHNMEQFEMVVMMSPLPNRLRYKNPSRNNIVESIELCRNTSYEQAPGGRILKSLKHHLQSNELADEGTIAMETSRTLEGNQPLSQMVALPFIIPLSFKDIMGNVVVSSSPEQFPNTTLSPFKDRSISPHQGPSNSRIEETLLQSSATLLSGSTGNTNSFNHVHGMQPTVQSNVTSSTYQQQHKQQQQQQQQQQTALHSQRSQQHSSLRQSSQHATSQQQQQSVQQSLPYSGQQKQVAAPPGTVLHTANPEIFALNTVYGLPDETNLLKRGGNGAVYTVTYGRRQYAVKKTPFRNREFQIHKKLKHANIVELSCFMFGPQQPEHRRRYFSYHFMPRVTGDLARMVTDRRDLVMTTLSVRHQNDPLKLGSIQGNWKYILKELLKGLNYMHSLNIVHRDMKASNVLIKMWCNCDNPLTCTCSKKCSVMISDFDAALELDELGAILPTPYHTQQKSWNSYQIVPVGTDGYRSPEMSQSVLSNDLGALTPPLTVKTDVWSVGLILMRILNGSNGPSRQRKLSTLLLYYEQEKFNERPQGVTKPPKFLKITRPEVDKILGFHKLGEFSNSWIRKAVECIARCVEVDPEKRPSAQQLLKHSFLY